MHPQLTKQNSSVAITFTPHPALYRVASEPATKPPTLAASPYQHQRLKELNEQLDRGEENLAEARQLYQQTLKQFAILCHQLWKQEKAQGSRQGKGFRSELKNAGIKVGRAYRAMTKFFPADFPVPSKPKTTKSLTSSAADEVDFRFTRKHHEGKEVLECLFTLTPEEKAEFETCLKAADASQTKRAFLEALKHALSEAGVALPPVSVAPEEKSIPSISSGASISSTPSEVTEASKSEIARNSAPCNGVSPVGGRVVPGPVPISSAPNKVDYNRPPEAPAKDQELKTNGLVLANKACPRLPRPAVGGERASRRDAGCDGVSPAGKDPAPRPFDAVTFASVLRLIRLQDSLELFGYLPPSSTRRDFVTELVQTSSAANKVGYKRHLSANR